MSMSYGAGAGCGGGPCGACKYLRRKCVKGCVFAPYFDSDQGINHFAAVHRVYGASNASKLLLRVPAHCRLNAVVTLCYEASARVRDPIYGCVGHIFALQQQIVNLQAELAHTQARISLMMQQPSPPPVLSSDMSCDSISMFRMPASTSLPEMVSYCNSVDDQVGGDDDCDLQSLTRDYVSTYFPGVIFKPPTSPHS